MSGLGLNDIFTVSAGAIYGAKPIVSFEEAVARK
jgi:hypothetical protein